MKTRILFSLIVLTTILLNTGCNRCRKTICSAWETFSLKLNGFPVMSPDTVWCIRYQKNTLFQHALDSFAFFPPVTGAGYEFNFPPEKVIRNAAPGEYDWMCKLPALDRSLKLFQVQYQQAVMESCSGIWGHRDEVICQNPLKQFSYQVNQGSLQVQHQQITWNY